MKSESNRKRAEQKTIFVVVGNGKFDPLIKKIDQLKEEGKIKKKIIAQIGHGTYHPKNCHWFKFETPLDKYYQEADLIISHGGPGAVFEILMMDKKLIAVPNRDRTDPRHQVEFLQAIEKETSALIYCDKIELLESCLEKAKTYKFVKYNQPVCNIHKVINEFLNKI